MSGPSEKPRRSEAELRKRREYQKRYRAENRERSLESERKARERVKQRKRLEAQQDPQGSRERQRAYNRARHLRDKATPGYEERVAKKSAAARVRRQTNPTTRAKMLAAKMKAAHGTDYETARMAFWEAQDGKCYLCGDPLGPGRATAMDHDHACCAQGHSCKYCRRGLACSRCNRVIGWADDTPDLLRRMADNLEPVLAATRARIATKAHQEALWPEAEAG